MFIKVLPLLVIEKSKFYVTSKTTRFSTNPSTKLKKYVFSILFLIFYEVCIHFQSVITQKQSKLRFNLRK